MAAAKANVYEMVTSRIIAELEKGNIPWEKPWAGVRSGAYNRISKKPYSIIILMLVNQILFIQYIRSQHNFASMIWEIFCT